MKFLVARTLSNLLPPTLYISWIRPALNLVEWTRIAPDTVVPTHVSPAGKPRTSGSGVVSAALAGGAAITSVANATAAGLMNRGNRTEKLLATQACDPPRIRGLREHGAKPCTPMG